MNEVKCPDCGFGTPVEKLEFSLPKERSGSLVEDASMTCPVCKSKFSISAMLTSPGSPGQEGEIQPTEEPEMPAEEPTPGEEQPSPEAGAEMGAGGGADTGLQIAPAESRVAKAMKLLKEGKGKDEIFQSMLYKPMKLVSLKRVRMPSMERLADRVNESLDDTRQIEVAVLENLVKAFSQCGEAYIEFDAAIDEARDSVEDVKDADERAQQLEARFSGGLGTGGRPEKFRKIANALNQVKDIQGDAFEPKMLANLAWAFSISPAAQNEFDTAVTDLSAEDSGVGPQRRSPRRPSREWEDDDDALAAESKLHEGVSPEQYCHLLRTMLQYSPNPSDRRWARTELAKCKEAPVGKDRFAQDPDLEAEDAPVGRDRFRQDPDLESASAKAKAWLSRLNESDVELPDDWKGDFATFNSKIFGICKDLKISVEEVENLLRAFDEAGAISLNSDQVKLDLDKTKKALIEYLSGKGETADQEAQAGTPPPEAPVVDVSQPPPPEPTDLGSAPATGEVPVGEPAEMGAAPAESVVEEKDENTKNIEDEVLRLLAKYFA